MSVAAFFDVDGTITRTTILAPLWWYQSAHQSTPRHLLWMLELLARVPSYLWIDRHSRGEFNKVFYRRYAGLNASDLRDWHRQHFAATLQRTFFPGVQDCIREHQRQGRLLILVTGGLDLVMKPLADFLEADELIATHLLERDGLLTGEIDGLPIADEEKAILVRNFARNHGVDLAQSFAYGNSLGDAPMLACVGRPVAVNPSVRFLKLALSRDWQILEWDSKSSGTSCA